MSKQNLNLYISFRLKVSPSTFSFFLTNSANVEYFVLSEFQKLRGTKKRLIIILLLLKLKKEEIKRRDESNDNIF